MRKLLNTAHRAAVSSCKGYRPSHTTSITTTYTTLRNPITNNLSRPYQTPPPGSHNKHPAARAHYRAGSGTATTTSAGAIKASSASPPPPPTSTQLWRHAAHCAVPMIGFGFMDNVVMIMAGDFIDSTLGVAFGLSTLTAAAYGQVVSDVSGTLFGNTIDVIATKLGMPLARLTEAQLLQRKVRVVGMLAAAAGVTIGCLLGMTTLLTKDLGKAERLKQQRELRTLFHTLMEEGSAMLGAEHCTLQLVDADSEHLFSLGTCGKPPTQDELDAAFHAYDRKANGNVDASELREALRQLGWSLNPSQVSQMIASVDVEGDGVLTREEFSKLMCSAIMTDEVRLRVRPGGTRHRVLTTGQMLNIPDVNQSPLCSREVYRLRGYETHSILIGPVLDESGRVIGLVELVNKEDERGQLQGFNADDEKLLAMLCAHCSLFLKNMELGRWS